MTRDLRSNALTLVDSAGHQISGQDDIDSMAVEYTSDYGSDADNGNVASAPVFQSRLVALVVLSVACTTAAIVAGSYALWLSRHSVAHEALSDVNAILKTCQDRMARMEQDFHQQSAATGS
ncbi:MAG: hypothetical protein M3Y13_08865 [Armatimonadota bacterium]|nr:hypothetical protein [Armatimonadota bacterium]